jgi:hypothetical protein
LEKESNKKEKTNSIIALLIMINYHKYDSSNTYYVEFSNFGTQTFPSLIEYISKKIYVWNTRFKQTGDQGGILSYFYTKNIVIECDE